MSLKPPPDRASHNICSSPDSNRGPIMVCENLEICFAVHWGSPSKELGSPKTSTLRRSVPGHSVARCQGVSSEPSRHSRHSEEIDLSISCSCFLRCACPVRIWIASPRALLGWLNNLLLLFKSTFQNQSFVCQNVGSAWNWRFHYTSQ